MANGKETKRHLQLERLDAILGVARQRRHLADAGVVVHGALEAARLGAVVHVDTALTVVADFGRTYISPPPPTFIHILTYRNQPPLISSISFE